MGAFKAKGNVGGVSNFWHSDQLFLSQPSSVTTLRAVRLPEVGGDTIFANMEQAYEDLDENLKAKLQDLTFLADWERLYPDLKRAAEQSGDWSHYDWLKRTCPPINRFPVVRTHPVTGKKALYVSQLNTQVIEGPGLEELGGEAALRQRLSDLVKVP